MSWQMASLSASRRLDGPAVCRHAGRDLLHRDQPDRRVPVSRRRRRPASGCAQQRRGRDQFLADADPAFHSDGRGALPYRPCAEGHRWRRAADPPGAGPSRGRRGRRRNDLLGDFGIDDRDHRHARLADAARDAVARLQPRSCDRPDHGDRRRRHAHSAFRADRSARQPVGHFDFQAADRRRGAGPDAQRRFCRLHRRPRADAARSCAGDPDRKQDRLGTLRAALPLCSAARLDLRRGDRRDVGRHCDTDGIGGPRRACDHGARSCLSRAQFAEPDAGACAGRSRSPA